MEEIQRKLIYHNDGPISIRIMLNMQAFIYINKHEP